MIPEKIGPSEPACSRPTSGVAYVDWALLEAAFDESVHGVRRYLHRSTGEIVRLIDGVSDPDLARRLEADSGYVRVAAVGPREQFGWLQSFIETVASETLRTQLASCVRGRGAFGRFKAELSTSPFESARWTVFRRERLREAIRRWAQALDLALVARRPARAPRRDPDPLASDLPVDRRARKRLLEVAGGLGPDDLEALHVLAEHLYAQQLARLDLPVSGPEAPAPRGAGAEEEEDEEEGRDAERARREADEALVASPRS